MKYLNIIVIPLALLAILGTYRMTSQIKTLQANIDTLQGQVGVLGSTVTSTASSDTLETFRTNVNASLSSLQNDKVSTTTAYTWTAQQTFSATTTMSKPLIITTTNAATSTLQVGCIQTTATSTASPVRITFTPHAGTTTTQGGTSDFLVSAQFGTCTHLQQ